MIHGEYQAGRVYSNGGWKPSKRKSWIYSCRWRYSCPYNAAYAISSRLSIIYFSSQQKDRAGFPSLHSNASLASGCRSRPHPGTDSRSCRPPESHWRNVVPSTQPRPRAVRPIHAECRLRRGARWESQRPASTRPAAPQHGVDRLQQDQQIEPETGVLQVVQIVLQLLPRTLLGIGVGIANLRPAGEAGPAQVA